MQQQHSPHPNDPLFSSCSFDVFRVLNGDVKTKVISNRSLATTTATGEGESRPTYTSRSHGRMYCTVTQAFHRTFDRRDIEYLTSLFNPDGKGGLNSTKSQGRPWQNRQHNLVFTITSLPIRLLPLRLRTWPALRVDSSTDSGNIFYMQDIRLTTIEGVTC